jgi:septum formation protein
MQRLILASTSSYKRALFERLNLPFEACDPAVDERARAGESPRALAARLARAKAAAASASAVAIGADQVPALGDVVLRKPGDHETALAQLLACSHRTVVFYTAVAVADAGAGRVWETVDVTEVDFAALSRERVERYLRLERPYDCAGGFKAEGLGIVLFDAIRSNDPTGLIGLPLIWLAATLRQAGFDPLAPTAT